MSSNDSDANNNPNKRPNSNAENSNKRAKVATIPSAADDLICPITLELPIDPVNAEDGQHYEREAIEQHIEKNRSQLRSPVLNKTMGPKLAAAPKIKSLIETLIKTRVITGELAEKWNEKAQQQAERKELERKAEAGDLKSMFKLGDRYMEGTHGFRKNTTLAFKWFQKAHRRGVTLATKNLGLLLLNLSKRILQGFQRRKRIGVCTSPLLLLEGRGVLPCSWVEHWRVVMAVWRQTKKKQSTGFRKASPVIPA